MRSYSLIAPAKINLYLEIIGTLPAQPEYHELAMVLQSVDLSDRVEVRPNGKEQFRIFCQHPQVPTDASNLAYRAAALMAKQFPETLAKLGAADITIDKHIPVAAGLAGGSSNAAAALVGIDLMWDLGLTQPELRDLGAQIGSDVPFCVSGGTCLATGRGDRISPLQDIDYLYVVLAKFRHLEVSTGWAYRTYREQFGATYANTDEDMGDRRSRFHSDTAIAAIAARDVRQIAESLRNDLERVVLPAYPKVAELRDVLTQAGSLGAMMSGSGPTVFALAESREQARQIQETAAEALGDPDLDFWVAKCITTGIQVADRE